MTGPTPIFKTVFRCQVHLRCIFDVSIIRKSKLRCLNFSSDHFKIPVRIKIIIYIKLRSCEKVLSKKCNIFRHFSCTNTLIRQFYDIFKIICWRSVGGACLSPLYWRSTLQPSCDVHLSLTANTLNRIFSSFHCSL